MSKQYPLIQIIKTYIKKYAKQENTLINNDLYYNPDSNICLLRGEYKSFKNANKDKLRENYKKINGYLCDKFNINPLEQFSILSNLQNHIVKNTDQFLYEGFNCYTASCGDGKTMAALYLMHVLKLKTLIISTRNAVNDQWKKELEFLYPELKVDARLDNKDKEENDVDVLICTPQYLCPKIQDVNKFKNFFSRCKFDLIIYDEIHSILSEQFSLVLALPFILKMNRYIKYLPYMIGLTASLPNSNSIEYKMLKTIFGEPIRFESEITKIPVYYTDHRDLITDRGFCDVNYVPMSDNQAFDYYTDIMMDNNLIPSKEFKLIIITGSIDSTIYAGINACLKFDQPVLIMRSNGEKNIYITPDTIPDFYHDIEEQSEKPNYTYDEIKRIKSIKKVKKYDTVINDVSIIVGTYHRLKEGFNCKNIVYGICTKFIWSETSRIQILGRIRRNSDIQALNEHKRYFFVNSGRIPSNLAHKLPHEKYEIQYDEKYEAELFKRENYIKVNEEDMK